MIVIIERQIRPTKSPGIKKRTRFQISESDKIKDLKYWLSAEDIRAEPCSTNWLRQAGTSNTDEVAPRRTVSTVNATIKNKLSVIMIILCPVPTAD